jgi:hypothetical protein
VHYVVDQKDVVLILDEPSRITNRPLQCVVVGTSKESQADGKGWLYVLLVLPSAEWKRNHYERVGVGRLRHDQIVINETLPIVSAM